MMDNNDLTKKYAFLACFVVLLLLVSWTIGSADFFATMSLALLVGIFCWDIEENFCILKEDMHEKNLSKLSINLTPVSNKITAYILNLDRAKERWEYVSPQVEKLGIPYERVSAVDGKKITKHVWMDIVDEESFCGFFKMHPEKGTIGCSLSHEKAWRKFLESDNEFALIFEDDVKFDPKVLSDVISDVLSKKELWDIVALELNHYGHPQKIAKLADEKYLVFYMTNVKHSGVYIINRFAAEEMLKRFYPIKMPLDHYFTRSWEFGLKFCGVEPRIVEQKFGDSQIKCDPKKEICDGKTILINALYNIYSSIMGSIYNFLLYLSSRRRL